MGIMYSKLLAGFDPHGQRLQRPCKRMAKEFEGENLEMKDLFVFDEALCSSPVFAVQGHNQKSASLPYIMTFTHEFHRRQNEVRRKIPKIRLQLVARTNLAI